MTIKNSDKKAIQALNFFAAKEGGKINRMKAIKLIWLSDRAHLRKFGRTILSDRYYAIKFGPIPSKAKTLSESNPPVEDYIIEYRDKYVEPLGRYTIQSKSKPELNVFSETDIEAMEAIYKTFGDKDKFQLSDLSHNFPEWKRFEKHFKVSSSRRDIDYSDFFNDTPESSKFFKESDELLKLSKEVYEEGCVIN